MKKICILLLAVLFFGCQEKIMPDKVTYEIEVVTIDDSNMKMKGVQYYINLFGFQPFENKEYLIRVKTKGTTTSLIPLNQGDYEVEEVSEARHRIQIPAFLANSYTESDIKYLEEHTDEIELFLVQRNKELYQLELRKKDTK